MTQWTEIGRFEWIQFASTQARQAFDRAAAEFETTASFTSRGDFIWAPAGTPLLRRAADGAALYFADPLPASASLYFTVAAGGVLKHDERVAKLRARCGLPNAELVTKSARTETPTRSYAAKPAPRGSWEQKKLLKRASAGFGTTVSQGTPRTVATPADPIADVMPQADPAVLRNLVMNELIRALAED